MKTPILALCMAALAVHARAQSVTYKHDDAKQNQITVMEIGSGSLTPTAYYYLLHNSYYESAAKKNKLNYRSQAGTALYLQVSDAETIDSCLTERGEVEALNTADRMVDVAWQTEGSKIETLMERFLANINRIVFVGGSYDERTRWMTLYNAFASAISETRSAYQPNSERKQCYLRLYDDLRRQNEVLVQRLVMLRKQKAAEELAGESVEVSVDKGSLAGAALGRWKVASGQ